MSHCGSRRPRFHSTALRSAPVLLAIGLALTGSGPTAVVAQSSGTQASPSTGITGFYQHPTLHGNTLV